MFQLSAYHCSLLLIAILTISSSTATCQEKTPAAEDSVLSLVEPTEIEAKIESQLNAALDLDFNRTALSAAMEHMSQELMIPISLDEDALQEASIPRATEVTFSRKSVRVRVALALLLQPLSLTYVVRDDTLLITSVEKAESILETKFYDVSDLFRIEHPEDLQTLDYDMLIELLTTTVAPEDWSQVGGPGEIQGWNGMLVVRQTRSVHDQLRPFLARLRLVRDRILKREKERTAKLEGEPVVRVYNLSFLIDKAPVPDSQKAGKAQRDGDAAAKLALEIRKDRRENAEAIAKQVLEVIQQYVSPEAWKNDESNVGSKVVGESIVIRQPREIQRQVEKVIEAMHAASVQAGGGLEFNAGGSFGGGGFF